MNRLNPFKAAAKAVGATHYETGKPCVKGHRSPRFTSCGKCVECSNLQSLSWRKAHPQRARQITRDHMRRVKGVPSPARPKSHACEICEKVTDKLHLDHCHETGTFRGWLCGGCNTALGHLGDNEAGILQAIAYLQRAEAQSA